MLVRKCRRTFISEQQLHHLSPNSVCDVLIVGAGRAGAGVAKALRRERHPGRITLIGEERHEPYERPPLSKDALGSGTSDLRPATLISLAALQDLGIELALNTRVTSIDRARRLVATSAGRSLNYDVLVLATGGRAAPPICAGADIVPWLSLRSYDDALRLREAFGSASRLAVVGGGWIGLETAAAARARGIDVVLIEGGTQLCARTESSELSLYLHRLHSSRGVAIRYGATVTEILRNQTGITLHLSCDDRIDVDAVVFGIGMIPNDELARDCGLLTNKGIVTDPCGRTDDPHIFACGDVTTFRHPMSARTGRIESWANAGIQSELCAKAITGQNADYEQAPWFWSDQWGNNIQIVGHFPKGARQVRRDGDDDNSFTVFSLEDARLTGAIAINALRTAKLAKRLIERSASIGAAELSDPAYPLAQALLAAQA